MTKERRSRYEFSTEFLDKKESKFEMRCLLCDEKQEYYWKSPSGPKMLEHLLNAHHKGVGTLERRKRSSYCSFSSTSGQFTIGANSRLASYVVTSHSSFNLLFPVFFFQVLKLFICILKKLCIPIIKII